MFASCDEASLTSEFYLCIKKTVEIQGKEEGGSVEAIVVFAFGSPGSLPGNKLLAERAAMLAWAHEGIPIVAQKDIPLQGSQNLIQIQEDGYVTTLAIALQFVRQAKIHGWRKVLVVAAPVHWARCLRDLEFAAEKEDVRINCIPDMFVVTRASRGVWYSWRSRQFWTWQSAIAKFREQLLMALPLSLYRWLTLAI